MVLSRKDMVSHTTSKKPRRMCHAQWLVCARLTSSTEENHVIKNFEANAPADHGGSGHCTRCPDVLRIGGG
jgi:hypothetical protein